MYRLSNIRVVGIGILEVGWEIRKTVPGAAGGRNIPFEQYSHSGNMDSGGGGKSWKTAPGAAGGVSRPFDLYSHNGIGILEGMENHGKLPQRPQET